MNDKSENIVRFTREPRVMKPYSPYENRVEFNTDTFSLTLKNMQKTDRGVYRVQTTRENETHVAEYEVSVIDAVEAPVLTVVSNCSSNYSCTMNVTCRGHDLTLSSTFQNYRCSHVEIASFGIITLILHFTEDSIICNHSNLISWKSETKDTEQLCSLHESAAVSPPAGVSLCLLKTVLFSVSLVIMMSAVITVHIREKLRRS
ncbi:uncharacterized protein LOC127443181 isoform X1 [Myxocyprinus asiaticus]|uniref:uncharacterized protein LOC127443181 isoform X1 n=2 Tax=Myxocyprinus asiaticus TaxID=70543 RepID=UPI00222394DC|nr:uncharacterized protein LOC127443181 isoform X1 [Myxocyprinus asiaticus]